MASPRQQRAAEAVIKNLYAAKPVAIGQVLKSVGYGFGLQNSPKRVLESDGFKEALENLGFTEANAKKVVGQILNSTKAKDKDRLKAAELTFKVHGSFAPERSMNVNATIDLNQTDTATQSLAEEYEEKLRQQMLNNGSTRTD